MPFQNVVNDKWHLRFAKSHLLEFQNMLWKEGGLNEEYFLHTCGNDKKNWMTPNYSCGVHY